MSFADLAEASGLSGHLILNIEGDTYHEEDIINAGYIEPIAKALHVKAYALQLGKNDLIEIRCKNCGKTKSANAFHVNKAARIGRFSTCKACKAAALARLSDNQRARNKGDVRPHPTAYLVDDPRLHKFCSLCVYA